MNESDAGPDFIGAGWAYPVRVNGRGGIALARGEHDIEESIRIILSTPVGERRMRPAFGCAVHDLVFAPNDPSTHGLVRQRILAALQLWEPRIEVHDNGIDIAIDPAQPGAMRVSIAYVVRSTNERRNLVYPFYLIPEEA